MFANLEFNRRARSRLRRDLIIKNVKRPSGRNRQIQRQRRLAPFVRKPILFFLSPIIFTFLFVEIIMFMHNPPLENYIYIIHLARRCWKKSHIISRKKCLAFKIQYLMFYLCVLQDYSNSNKKRKSLQYKEWIWIR